MDASCFSLQYLPAWATPDRLRYSLRLGAASPSNNVIKGLHFHAYRKLRQDYQAEVLALLGGKAPQRAIETSGLVVLRHCVGSLDYDNLYGGLKPLLDCLVQASARNPSGLGLIVDDSAKHMPEPPYARNVKAKRGQDHTELFVFELPPT
jgi:hypothetical protein